MRIACASGGFYPGRPEQLRESIKECFAHELGPKCGASPVIGGIVPHAGYAYSGPAAAWFYHQLTSMKPKPVILVGPNHTGLGSPVSVSAEDSWETPLGPVSVDSELRGVVCDRLGLSPEDDAHRFEHSIEVQLPFLQFVWGTKFSFLPISVGVQDSETCERVGKAISGLDALIIASSDLNHYLPARETMRLDELAINAVLSADPDKLLSVVRSNNITMCGVAPVAVMLWALRDRMKKIELLSHYTSGDITGDNSSVVGYASFAVR